MYARSSKRLQKTAQELFVLEYVKGIRKKDHGIGGKKLWYMYCREFKIDHKNHLIPSRPNQLWVSDITYITIWVDEYHYVFCYLSLILDAYTEEIVGWSIGPTLETTYPLEALRMALKRIEGVESPDLIHHSDRGCQYASKEYIKLLNDNHIRISMT